MDVLFRVSVCVCRERQREMSSLSSTSGPGSGPGSAQAPELISLSSIPRESIEFAERMQQMRGGGYMDSDEEEDEMYAPMRTSKEVDDSYAKYTWNWYRSQYKLPSKAPETQAVDDFRDLRIKNQHASSSGVGSQDFHTYRWLRRKERFRLQIMDQAEKEVGCLFSVLLLFLGGCLVSSLS